MALSERELRTFLSSAESSFISALSQSDAAVSEFQTQWDRVLSQVQDDSTLDSTTYELVLSVGSAIKSLADTMMAQELDVEAIGQDLHSKLSSNIHRRARATLRRRRRTRDPESPLPLPPYIAPCYHWLLKNLHNPYPSPSTKQQLLRDTLDQLSTNTDALLTPPPSPTSSPHSSPKRSTTPSAAAPTLEDVDRWFAMARMRIGWGDVRRAKFNGSRPLMLEAARRMWSSHEELHNTFTSASVSQRRVTPKREDVPPSLKSPYETVTFRLPTPEPSSPEEGAHLPSSALAPDVELAFVCIEAQAKAMYAHCFAPTELAESSSSSVHRRPEESTSPSQGVADPRQLASSSAYRMALAKAAADKRRAARQEQRRARAELRREDKERASYPSPEPESDDESSSASYSDGSSYCSESFELDGSDASDEREEDSDDDEVDEENDVSSPFASYAAARTTFLTPPLRIVDDAEAASDEDEYSDDDGSESDGTEDSDVTSDEDDISSYDELSDEEDATPPPQLAGCKRRSDDESPSEEHRPEKRPRHVRLPSSGPRPYSFSPTLLCTSPAHSASSIEAVHALPRPRNSLVAQNIARLSPPCGPAKLGPDGVPAGTVRARLSQTNRRRLSALTACDPVKLMLPCHTPPSGSIKVTGDPTPWVNWNLDVPAEHQVASPAEDSTHPAQTVVTRGPKRSPSISSIASTSSSSSSSSSSDTASLFSVCSADTDATEPEQYTPEKRQRASPRPVHPLFDPNVWSKYDLDAISDGKFQQGSGRQASAFVPTKVHVEAIDLRALPTKNWSSALRSPVRLASSTAAPVVSYHDAVGTISSPSKLSFGEGQLTATLPTGRSAGNTLRKTSPVKQRIAPPAPETQVPSSLVAGILNSGLADVCKETPLVKAPKKDRRYAERAERRASKSSPVDSDEIVRARLAEIEQQAARLEAERQTLQRLASVGG
uniref:Mating type protein A-alpha Z6 n=1 Tax=Schizophyllum commune TaxID=5334 RepID=Q9P449_SCHCO|nr:mating type protein A-alpha Z6 [Schizophyllum commune]